MLLPTQTANDLAHRYARTCSHPTTPSTSRASLDGHGVYDPRSGLGGLCFEQPTDDGSWRARTLDFVDAARLARLVRDHRIPLVFLEACQTAVAKVDPTSSVGARLLSEGVTSVVAMTHSVLVEIARRFVAQFYADLAGRGDGRRRDVGWAAGAIRRPTPRTHPRRCRSRLSQPPRPTSPSDRRTEPKS
jgi:CHAT domain